MYSDSERRENGLIIAAIIGNLIIAIVMVVALNFTGISSLVEFIKAIFGKLFGDVSKTVNTYAWVYFFSTIVFIVLNVFSALKGFEIIKDRFEYGSTAKGSIILYIINLILTIVIALSLAKTAIIFITALLIIIYMSNQN